LRLRILLASTLALTLLALTHPAWAWSNGGYSADPNNPDYGTHDWIAERALDWLPANEKALILTYRVVYLYGTELPDNCQAADKLCDTGKHHVYFRSSGDLQDDASAGRARDMQSQALSAIAAGDYASAAKWTGAMTHYISDLASFGHVMGAGTDWGAEPESVHSSYENHVQTLTRSRDANVISLNYDGTLSAISPYDAALALARDTTFDLSAMGHTAVWMNQTNNWNDPAFTARAYQSINLAVNYVAEAVHATWSAVAMTSSTVDHVVINEFEQNPPGEDRDHEWLELFNPTLSAVDIGNWIIFTTHGDIESYVIPAGTVILPGGFWLVPLPGLFIDNEQDSLVLLNALGQQVDATPSKADEQNDANSWQRYPDGSDTWVFAPSTANIVNVPEFISPLLVALVLVASVLVIMRRCRKRGISDQEDQFSPGIGRVRGRTAPSGTSRSKDPLGCLGRL